MVTLDQVTQYADVVLRDDISSRPRSNLQDLRDIRIGPARISYDRLEVRMGVQAETVSGVRIHEAATFSPPLSNSPRETLEVMAEAISKAVNRILTQTKIQEAAVPALNAAIFGQRVKRAKFLDD